MGHTQIFAVTAKKQTEKKISVQPKGEGGGKMQGKER